MKMSLNLRIFLLSVVLVGITLGTSAMSIYYAHTIRLAADECTKRGTDVANFHNANAQLNQSVSYAMEHAIIRDHATLKKFSENQDEFKKLHKKTVDIMDTPEEIEKIAVIGKKVDELDSIYTKEIVPLVGAPVSEENNQKIAMLTSKMTKLGDEIEQLSSDIIKSLENEAVEAKKLYIEEIHSVIRNLLIIAILGAILGLAWSYTLSKKISNQIISISTRLGTGADETTQSSAEVSSASQVLAEGANEQAASIEETSSSLEEMSSMTQRNADSAKVGLELAKGARQAAEEGVHDIEQMERAIHQIDISTQKLNEAMKGVSESSHSISTVIKTIDEIAFQTNILALNAAVEAARAGEAGLGFAVVADEVRALAQRSASASRETAQMIQDSISKTEVGAKVSEQVAVDLQEIINQVKVVGECLNRISEASVKVDKVVSEIATASSEQSQGISQVNVSIGQMDKITQSNAATAEQTASSAALLSSQAENMKSLVHELMGIVGLEALEIRQSVQQTSTTTKRTTPAPARKVLAVASKSESDSASAPTSFALPQPSSIKIKEPVLSGKVAIPMEGDFKDF